MVAIKNVAHKCCWIPMYRLKNNYNYFNIESMFHSRFFLWKLFVWLQLSNAHFYHMFLLTYLWAEAFLQHHESNTLKIALEQTPSVTPKSFLHYVDDSHAWFNTNNASLKFQNILNKQHPNIKYTIETEDDNKRLQFLDLNIHNNNGVYKYKIHRKNAIMSVQVKPHSGHNPKVF